MGKQNGKRYHFLYRTTNLINGKFYIGVHSTYNLKDGYLGSGKRLKRAIKKYGEKNFKNEILEFFETRKEVFKREKEIVNEKLINDSLCMNLQPGGGGGFINKEHQLKIRKGASKWIKKKWKDLEYRKKMCEISSKKLKNAHKQGKIKYDNFKGKKHSKKTKRKMSEKAKLRIGKKSSQFGTCWILNEKIKQCKKIQTFELKNWIKMGWKKGRKMNF